MDIQLTPTGQLRLLGASSAPDDPVAVELANAFERDWREGFFELAAGRPQVAAGAGLRWWQAIAEAFLTALCHIPADSPDTQATRPSDEQVERWLATAPPMPGAEYLAGDVLQTMWSDVDAWVQSGLPAADGLQAFIARRAPRWRQVGRVSFHLAENKNNPVLPFAFMATFTSAPGSGARPVHAPLRRALEDYAGAKNRQALIRLLTPVEQAATRVPWVREMVDSGAIYQPRAWSVANAHRLLADAEALEASGVTVRLPDWWKSRPRPRVQVRLDQTKGAILSTEALMTFDVGVALGEETLSPEEVETLLAGSGSELVQLRGKWIEVDRDRLREALAHWRSVETQAARGDITFIEGMRLLAGAPKDLGGEPMSESLQEWQHVEASGALREMLAHLRDPAQLPSPHGITDLAATLRPYQRHGVSWLTFLSELGLGACLADDMGLGKTLQVLALLLHLRKIRKAKDAPSLLVVPASLLGNWKREAQRFAPTLVLRFVHPAETDVAQIEKIAAAPQSQLRGCDLVVTTYSMVTRQEWLRSVKWNLVILDEAQAIKNAQTRQSRAVRGLAARARVVMTGTPVENRVDDLWSLFDFVNPGLLGSATAFKAFVKRLDRGSGRSYAPLRKLVAPYILRRLKTDRSIISDLPPKTEIQAFCALGKTQARLYQRAIETLRETIGQTAGIERRGLVLQVLMRLKQICNHPSQALGNGEYAAADSGKFQRLAALCEEMAERQERVLVFTQFREIVEPLAAHLGSVFGRAGLVLHGGTPVGRRQALVDRFQQDGGPPFMVLSLKAGGTGLNLTQASQVVHFDRWWNPAVENQATDRAFRIGQQRPVMVHKFVTSGTVEERIDAMIADKRKLADDLLGGGAEVDVTGLDDDQLLDLVRLDLNRALA